MALDVKFQSDIADQLNSILFARYGYTVPQNTEYLEALDAMGKANGLERMQDSEGKWFWGEVSMDNRMPVEF